ncbi:MAG: hypothetical protein ACJ8OJ_14900 [Povalibacter sp.]
MFTVAQISSKSQRAVCLFLSTLIVVASLSLGAYGAAQAAHTGYSVTITQLQ